MNKKECELGLPFSNGNNEHYSMVKSYSRITLLWTCPYKRLSKFGIEKRIGQLGEFAGIERRVFPHLIRHTTASDGLNRGMGIEEVQAILGHESIATTMIYAKVSKNNVKLHHTKCIV